MECYRDERFKIDFPVGEETRECIEAADRAYEAGDAPAFTEASERLDAEVCGDGSLTVSQANAILSRYGTGRYLFEDVFITGDTHGDLLHLSRFARKRGFKRNGHMAGNLCIILGDAGLNYDGGKRDVTRKNRASRIPMTFLCIHGNHEMRPYEVKGYEVIKWNGGDVYRQKEFPRLLFAKDGEVYCINGVRYLAIGGAYSVDKFWRILHGYPWFPSEQPDEETKKRVEEKLDEVGWKVDVVLSHTCPLRYEPVEIFPEIDQTMIDRSTEQWLDTIEARLDYAHWYCAHSPTST